MGVGRHVGEAEPGLLDLLHPAKRATCSRLAARRARFHVNERGGVRDRSAAATNSAAASMSSCSQIRMGSHPAWISKSSVSMSRRLLPSIFALHQSALARGHVPCSWQPCQKHPLTKIATLAFANTMSACRLRAGSGRRWMRKRRPRRCSADLSARSGAVSFRRWRCMRPLTPGEEATTVSDCGWVSGMSGAYATNRSSPQHAERRRASPCEDAVRAP
jgi:hypothetical protein